MPPEAWTGLIALLRADPELAVGLSAEELEDAERLVIVPGLTLEPGPWDLQSLHFEPSLGVLMIDGLVTANVTLGDRVTARLAGPGDLLIDAPPPHPLVPVSTGYLVSEETRVAVLDRRFIAAVRRWPALLVTLHERLRMQERRAAIHGAIGTLRRVEDRVLALLWHLAERWGRVTADGMIVPLGLTHEALGRLAGAERPTVSLALRELARTGAVSRREDGAFLLRGQSWRALAPRGTGEPAASAARLVRSLRVPEPTGRGDVPSTPAIDVEALRRRVAALQEELPERTRDVEERLAAARASAERSATLRAGRAQERRTG